MKKQRCLHFNLACFSAILLLSLGSSRAANISFAFQQTTGNGMDLFTTGGLAGLITNSTSPSVYFALGYLPSAYDFTSKTRENLVADIQGYIGSSNTSWSNVGTAQATGGKVNVSFDNSGAGFATTTLGWSGKKLVAVISQGVNPVNQTITSSTPLAIVRGGTSWDSILSSDATPGVTIQSLSLVDFTTILVGNYASSVGNLNSTGSTKFDTVTLIPEPTSSALVSFGMLLWLAKRRKSPNARL